MSVVTGQIVQTLFTTSSATTGAAENATVGPVGTLYVNGVATADVVTVANIAVGVYRATVTMPVLVAGDDVAIRVTATVGVASEGKVWEDCRDGYIDNLDAAISTRGTANAGDAMALTAAYDAAKTAAQAGDAMTLQPAERTTTAAVFLSQLLEGVHTVGDGLRIMLAALAGKSTGGGTFTNRFRDVADSKNRIDATVDANGNRSAISIDGT